MTAGEFAPATAEQTTAARGLDPRAASRGAVVRLAWWREVGVLAALYALYEVVRSMTPSRVGTAYANAAHVLDAERLLHVDVELWVNRLGTASPLLSVVSSAYYQVAHESVALCVLVYLWCRRPHHYSALRTTLVATSLSALFVYWTFPVAPPRLAMVGTVDTVATNPVLMAGSESVTGLANLYAAMPSVHVAWAVWCALAVSVATGWRYRYLVWLYPATTVFVVLLTANHYVLDGVAGAVLPLLVWRAAAPGISSS